MKKHFGDTSIAEPASEVFPTVSARHTRKGLKSAMAVAAMAGSCVFLACGANGADQSTEKTESASEGLGEVGCTTVTPNVTIPGSYSNNGNVGSSYGSTSCPQQYVLRMNGAYTGTGTAEAWITSVGTISQADCPNTEASVDLYGSNNGTLWATLGKTSSYGTWGSSSGPFGNGCLFSGSPNVDGDSVGAASGWSDYIVVGALLQHPANKSTAFDQPIAMGVEFQIITPP